MAVPLQTVGGLVSGKIVMAVTDNEFVSNFRPQHSTAST
jgi:hypothetical protein